MVALLDMDAFFASVECARNPFLSGKPVAVIGWGRRTAISSANYVAKKFGVRTGMAPQMAEKLCPNLVLVKADFAEYESISLDIESLVCKFFPIYIRSSIDEFYIDLNIANPIERLKRLKQEIFQKHRLTCSIGVAPNPILSKIASETCKPNGFKMVGREQILPFVQHLPISVIPGVGQKTEEYLKRMNVETVGDLIEFSKTPSAPESIKDLVSSLLSEDFDRKEFFRRKPPKSFSHMKTFDLDVSENYTLKQVAIYLLYRAYLRMVREGYGAKTVSLIVKHAKSGAVSCSKSLSHWSNDFLKFTELLDSIFSRTVGEGPVRMLGVSLSDVKPMDTLQLHLFRDSEKIMKAFQLKGVEISSRLFMRKVSRCL
ncbi:Y-family DNA polymerase [Pseudothermotoga sp.]